jgi:hypothetical protein
MVVGKMGGAMEAAGKQKAARSAGEIGKARIGKTWRGGGSWHGVGREGRLARGASTAW